MPVHGNPLAPHLVSTSPVHGNPPETTTSLRGSTCSPQAPHRVFSSCHSSAVNSTQAFHIFFTSATSRLHFMPVVGSQVTPVEARLSPLHIKSIHSRHDSRLSTPQGARLTPQRLHFKSVHSRHDSRLPNSTQQGALHTSHRDSTQRHLSLHTQSHAATLPVIPLPPSDSATQLDPATASQPPRRPSAQPRSPSLSVSFPTMFPGKC